MKIEICIGGGGVAETLSHATHLVIVSSPEIDLDFDTLLNRWAILYHAINFDSTFIGKF